MQHLPFYTAWSNNGITDPRNFMFAQIFTSKVLYSERTALRYMYFVLHTCIIIIIKIKFPFFFFLNQAQNISHSQAVRHLKILIYGRDGVGKSSLAYSLLGKNCAGTEHDLSLEGIEIHIHESDSPGLDDSNKYDLVLFCIDTTAPFAPADKVAIRLLSNTFGLEIWKRCVLVLTKANQLSQMAEASATIEYHKKVFQNFRSTFCSCIQEQGVPASVCDGLHMVAAGISRRDNYSGRFLYFASEHSIANLCLETRIVPKPLALVDFLIELWTTILETVPEASRMQYLQAKALGGHIRQGNEEPTRELLEMTAEYMEENIFFDEAVGPLIPSYGTIKSSIMETVMSSIMSTIMSPVMSSVMSPVMSPMIGPVMCPVMGPVLGPVFGAATGVAMSPIVGATVGITRGTLGPTAFSCQRIKKMFFSMVDSLHPYHWHNDPLLSNLLA